MRYQSLRFILIAALLNLIASPAFAIISFNKYWMPVTLNGNYGDFFYWFEPQIRLVEPQIVRIPTRPFFVGQTGVFQQFLGSIAGAYEVYPEWKFWIGQTITTESQDAVRASQEEYRAFEQLTWDHTTQRYGIKINSRLRTEQRHSLNFPQWAFRIRERLIFNFPLTHNMSYELSDEALYNLNVVPWIDTTAWDQNRAYIAIVQRFSVNYAFAVGYLNQYLFRREPQMNHVLYLNLRFDLPT